MDEIDVCVMTDDKGTKKGNCLNFLSSRQKRKKIFTINKYLKRDRSYYFYYRNFYLSAYIIFIVSTVVRVFANGTSNHKRRGEEKRCQVMMMMTVLLFLFVFSSCFSFQL